MLLLFCLLVFSGIVYFKDFKELKNNGAKKGEKVLYTIVLLVAVVINGIYFLDIKIKSPLVFIVKMLKPISKIMYF